MIGDVIDTFRNTTPAVNQEFVRKSLIETTICHSASCWKKLSVNHVFLSYAILQPNVNNAKRNKYLLKMSQMQNLDTPNMTFEYTDVRFPDQFFEKLALIRTRKQTSTC